MKASKVALITGASRGIGRAIALALAGRGWEIVINYRSNREAALEVERFAADTGAKSLLIQADLTSAAERERLVEGALEYFGRLDLLVNNAGVAPLERTDMLQVGEDSYNRVMDTNLKGPFFLTQHIANKMIALIRAGVIPDAKIVTISSISAYASSPQRAEYCISKAGLSMMTTLWADRLSEYGIRVYEIRPGVIQTDMTAAVTEKYDRLIMDEGLTPLQRWGLPDDVARAVLAIADDLLPFSTGEVINVDGGFHVQRL